MIEDPSSSNSIDLTMEVVIISIISWNWRKGCSLVWFGPEGIQLLHQSTFIYLFLLWNNNLWRSLAHN
jgi:hypothetical protein